MPELKPASLRTFFLPSTSGATPGDRAEVTLDPLLTVAELDPDLPVDRALEGAYVPDTLVRHIAAWNYTDAAGAPLPIDRESVGRLAAGDYHFLMGKLRVAGTLPKRERERLLLYLDNAAEGRRTSWTPPLSYLLYQYRERFGISYPDLMATPLSVILQDLQFREIEQSVSNKHKR